jgi:hypothetical protein
MNSILPQSMNLSLYRQVRKNLSTFASPRGSAAESNCEPVQSANNGIAGLIMIREWETRLHEEHKQAAAKQHHRSSRQGDSTVKKVVG